MRGAGCQAILQDFAGGHCSHVLANSKWGIWHSNTWQGVFPPHTDWRRALTQPYYMMVDTWPVPVLMYTICAPNKRPEPAWASPPTLICGPEQE